MTWNDLIFEHRNYLWLLGFIPMMFLVFVYESFRSRRALSRFGNARLVARLVGSAPPWRRHLRRFLWLVALLLMTIAALRPRAGFKTQQVQHVGIDIAVILDVSRSMLVPDVPPNRLKAAITDISGLLSRLRGGRVALVPVAGVGFVQCPLTSDHEVIRQYLADLDVQEMPVPGTNLGHALSVALGALGAKPEEHTEEGAVELVHRYEGAKYRAIVLFTDGEDFGQALDDALERVKQAGISIITVGVGTPSGKPVPVLDQDGKQEGVQKDEEGKPVFSGLNEELLARMATETNGSFHSLSQGSVVGPIFSEIDRMEKQEYESQIAKLREDRYPLLLWLALFMLALEWLISELQRGRRLRETGGKLSRAAGVLVLLSMGGLGGCSLEEAPFVVESSAVNEALEHIEKRTPSKALASIEEARKTLSDQPELDLNEGLALLGMGEAGEAIRRFERALERMPSKYRARTLYALALSHAHHALAREREAASLSEMQDGDGSEPAAESLVSWKRARDLFEEVLNKEEGHEGARVGLEMALYRTDPPCFMRDTEGEPDMPPAEPRPFPLDPEKKTGQVSSLLCPDDQDRFSLAMAARHRLFLTLDGESDQGKAVLGASGLPGLQEDPERTSISSYVAKRDTEMVFTVKHLQALSGEVAYDLEIQTLAACEDMDAEFPKDDTPGAANRIDDVADAPLRLCPGDQDHFAVEVLEGQSILALVDITDPPPPQAEGEQQKPVGRGPRVPGQPEDVAPQIRILDMALNTVSRGFGSAGRTLAVLPEPPPGGYFVEVRPPEEHPNLETPYRLTLLRIPPCPIGNLDDKMLQAQEQPANDLPDQAIALQPGAIALGRVCPGDLDWYSMQADEEKPTVVEVLFERARSKLVVEGFYDDDLDGAPIQSQAVPVGAIFEIPKLEEAEFPRVSLRGDGELDEGFYMLRHISQPPSESSGDDDQDGKEGQDQQDEEDQKDQNQDEQEQSDQKQEQENSPAALEQLLQDMDQNPRNLEADEAAKKARGTIVLPTRDW